MKNAKKSMFITTILMVAVLVVALSTATFAWYTSSNSGSAESVTITSAKSDSANITIGWMATDTTTSIKDLAPATDEVAPCVPVAQFANTNVFANAGEGQSIMAFNKAAINTDGTFREDGAPATADLWKISHTNTVNPDNTDDGFYVTNRHTTTASDITMEIVVEDGQALKSQLFVAVFIDNVYAGVLNATGANYTYGVIGIDDPSTPGADGGAMATATTTSTISFNLASGANAKIQLVAWLDGTTTLDADSNKTVEFSFDFNATLA